MKIFISYGHNDYTPLVDRLFDALSEAGHQPWKDDRYEGSSGIAPGQDFTEVIYKAIDEADFVIAFVTRCTRKKPYCRDERQYAYNKKGTHFIQIRMDNVEITLGNARSYIDMSDVVDATGRIHEKLFENSLKGIFAAFRDPMSFAEGGITPWTKIDTHLKVPGSLKYHDFIGTLDQKDFVGRQWLLNRCRDWARDDTIARRLFIIYGEAGTGKTAFIRHLSRDEELVRSVHVCIYDRPSTRTVRDTLKDLAYVLAHKCQDYYRFLKTENLEKLTDMTEDGMFEFLFLEPLKTVKEKYLLIIDGLDELEEAAGLRPLIRLFRQYSHRINPNISFLVTTRPDETITDLIKTVGKGQSLKSITLSKDANREDLQLYTKQKLQELGRYDEALAEKILDACDGNFEYLSLLFSEAAEEGLAVSEDMPLPRGLNERYIQYLDRHMEARDIGKITRQQRQLLGLLCTAREPIPLSLLAEITDTDEYDVLDELDAFGSLIHKSEESDPRISLFTKGFRDFLLSKCCRRYSVDSKAGTALLAQYLMDTVKEARDFAKQPYLDRCGFVHLLQYAEEAPEDVCDYLRKLSEKDINIALPIADALTQDIDGTVEGYLAVEEALDVSSDVFMFLSGKRAAAPLDEIARRYQASGKAVDALILQTSLLMWTPSPEHIAKSYELCLQALRLAEKAYADNPCYESRHTLFKACERLGTLAERRNGTEDSAHWYRRALELSEENHREKPGYQSRYSLSLACERLGHLARNRGTATDLAEAESWFLRAQEFSEQNYLEKPCYASRSDILVGYGTLGELAMEKRTAQSLEQAQQYFRKMLELARENHRENPCYASRRTLSHAYENMGDLATTHGTTAALKEAESWYREMLQLDQLNYQEYPSYQSRYCCIIAYSRLGDLAQDNEIPKQAKDWFEKNLELSLQNHRENPCTDSRRTLALAYDRLGSLLEEENTPESLAEAEGHYLKALELNQQNIREEPSQNHIRDLALTYGRLGKLAKETSREEAENWYRKMLQLDEQRYAANPCYESRRDLSITCLRLGNLVFREEDKATWKESEKWHLRSMELDEENYRINPCYQSRSDLSDTYSRCAYLAQLKDTPKSRKESEKWSLKRLELNLENYREDPCFHSRMMLSDSYEKLALLFSEKNTKKARAQLMEWMEKKLALDEQNLLEKPCEETRQAVCATYGALGSVCDREDSSDGRRRAEDWFRKKLVFDRENLLENPCPDNMIQLALTCERLGNFCMEKDTPEATEESTAFFQEMRRLYEQLLEDHPYIQLRQALSRAYTGLSKIAEQQNLAEALEWMLKARELEAANLAEQPSEDNRFYLSAVLDKIGALWEQRDTPEALEEAEKWYLRALALDEESFRENPNEDNAENLWLGYGRLGDIARQRNTPASKAEAEKWDTLQAELEAAYNKQ